MSFCAGTWYNAASGRCVGRASSGAHAYGGLVYAYANSAASGSGTHSVARLAFSGTLTNDAEIDKQIEANLEEYDEE